MSAAWFVVHTQPQAEEKAARHIAAQDITVYLPRYRRNVRHARRTLSVLRALFPNYLFVRLDPELCRWRAINGTVGVRHILTDGGMPLRVPERIVSEIVAREDDTGAVKLALPVLSPGQAVRIAEGPLADLDGLFEVARDDVRAILLVSLLGRKVRVEVPAVQLATA